MAKLLIDAAATMPTSADRCRLKDRIIDNIAKAIKHIQVYRCREPLDIAEIENEEFNKTEGDCILKNSDWQFQKLVDYLDHAFLHGLKSVTKGYWIVVQEFTHESMRKDINQLSLVTTNLGRGRAWLYMALMDNLLECYVNSFMDNSAHVKRFYCRDALALDNDRLSQLLTLTSGLSFIIFQLEVNVAYLDLYSYDHTSARGGARGQEDDEEWVGRERREGSDSRQDDNISVYSMNSISSDQSYIADVLQTDFHHSSSQSSLSSFARLISFGSEPSNCQSSSSNSTHFTKSTSDWSAESERISRLCSMDVTSPGDSIDCVTTSDGFSSLPCDDKVEVIRLKPKRLRSKMKQSTVQKFKSNRSSSDDASIHSLDVSTLRQSATPESGYRSVLDDPQSVSINNTDLHLGITSSNPHVQSDNPLLSSSDTYDRGQSVTQRDTGCDTHRVDSARDLLVNRTQSVISSGLVRDTSQHSITSVESSETDKSSSADLLLPGNAPEPLENLEACDDCNNSVVGGVKSNVDCEIDSLSTSESIRSAESLLTVYNNEGVLQDNSSNQSHSVSNSNISSAGAPVIVGLLPAANGLHNSTTEQENSQRSAASAAAAAAEELTSSLETASIYDDVPKFLKSISRQSMIYEASGMNPNVNDDSERTCLNNDSPSQCNTFNGEGLESCENQQGDRHLMSAAGRNESCHESPMGKNESHHESPTGSADIVSVRHRAEESVDNNLLVEITLEVFKYDEEKFHKLYRTCVDHTEGEPHSVQLLLTTHSLYLVSAGPSAKQRFIENSALHYSQLDYISIGVDGQVINIVCKDRRKQLWITTGDELLTRCIMDELRNAMSRSVLELPEPTVVWEATTQLIATKKLAAAETNMDMHDVQLLRCTLVHWEDNEALSAPDMRLPLKKEGYLYYKPPDAYGYAFGGNVWTESLLSGSSYTLCYFVLRDGTLSMYDDKNSRKTAQLSVTISATNCIGCRASPKADRPHSFEIKLANGSRVRLAAETRRESTDWIHGICMCMAESGSPMQKLDRVCIACCCVLTQSAIIMYHEELVSNFVRALGVGDLANLSGIELDDDDKDTSSYCILVFKRENSSSKSLERWAVYFYCPEEREKFVELVKRAYTTMMQVSLNVLPVERSVAKRCRCGASKLHNATSPLITSV